MVCRYFIVVVSSRWHSLVALPLARWAHLWQARHVKRRFCRLLMQFASPLLPGVHSAPRAAFLRRRSEISLDGRAICAVATAIHRRSGAKRRNASASR
jgi:hypothetical protein